jgi:hypothetical protein
MFYKTSGLVVISSFFQHLEKKHYEYLIQSDRTLVTAVPSAPSEPRVSDMCAYFPGPRAIESTVAIAAASSPPLSRAESRFNAQADSIQRDRITQAVVEVIAHGP